MKVSIIQPELFWEDTDKNLKHLDEFIHTIEYETELLVLPEMFTTGFSMKPEFCSEKMNGKAHHWMKKWASQKKMAVVGSLMMNVDSTYINRCLFVKPDGSTYYYDKKHLFSPGAENLHYTSGNTQVDITFNNFKFRLGICYDLRFPVWLRNNTYYDAFIVVANWPAIRSNPWRILIQARAMENQCYVLACNRVGVDANGVEHSGHSLIVNPDGNILNEMIDKEGILYGEISKNFIEERRKSFPVLKDIDDFKIL